MATILALEKLHTDVVARFDAEASPPGSAPAQPFGWREPGRRTGGRRIVWVPGNDQSGDAGELAAPKYPGRNPRPLATLGELFTVYLEAQDSTAAEDEKKQYAAARLLFDAWWRAVYLAGHGTVALEALTWVKDKTERRFGAALRALCRVEAMIPDEVQEVAPVGTGAAIETSELDVDEDTIIAAPVLVATTTAIALSGLQTIDGQLLAAGDRVLVKDQAAPATNGIYLAAAGAWTRAPDADTSAEVPSGLLVAVGAGTDNGESQWLLTTPPPINLGVTALTFARVPT